MRRPDAVSALAIATALTLRAVFRLALRQAEGLIGSIIALLGFDLSVPDHTTLSNAFAKRHLRPNGRRLPHTAERASVMRYAARTQNGAAHARR
ncbi:MAG: transposase [Janthinobacterium lividum]